MPISELFEEECKIDKDLKLSSKIQSDDMFIPSVESEEIDRSKLDNYVSRIDLMNVNEHDANNETTTTP